MFETAKGYRENKAIPFFQVLMKKLFSLYTAYCNLKNKYEQLVGLFEMQEDSLRHLSNRNETLEQKVEHLKDVQRDFGFVQKRLGLEVTNRMINEGRADELSEKIKHEKSKVQIRKNHEMDVR